MALASRVLSRYVHFMSTAPSEHFSSSRPAAMMTARVVAMMTPEEKRMLEARAREFDLTPSEFIRQAGQKFDPSFDDSFFEIIAVEIEANNAAMRADLSGLVERIDATVAAMAALRAGK